MSLSLSEVEHIAELARLSLSQAEKERLRKQLSAILVHVDRLQQLDTEGDSLVAADLPTHRSLRTDFARPTASQEDVLANAPASENNHFLVPPLEGTVSAGEPDS